jgi:2-polyprenyl-6-hydroxyphenyl methylase/3-demethylubiquinone-9 3-methyltransferase
LYGWKLAVATPRINWVCSKVEGSKVIDIGCSKGIASILLARQGFEVVGVDFDEERIEYANADKKKESLEIQGRLRFICGNIYDIDLPEHAFHTAIMGEFLEHQARPDKAITRAQELMVDDGTLIVTVPFGLFIHPDHKQTFYIASLYKVIYPCFVISEFEIIGSYLCLLCKRREAVLEKQINSIDLALVERIEQEFQNREVTLTRECDKGRKEAEKFKAKQNKSESQLQAVKNSFSYQLGNMLVQAVYKPGSNTILLPYRLIRLCIAEFKKRKAM